MRALRLPAARPASLRCLRSAVTSGGADSLRSCGLSAPCPRRPGACSAGGPLSGIFPGDDRISHVPGESLCVSAPLSDPGRMPTSRHNDVFVLPSRVGRRRLQHTVMFRGSITRLLHSLSTLPRLRYLRRARLVSGWWLTFTRWDSNPQDSGERFQTPDSLLESSSFPRLIMARPT